jgi:hypothetical protein
VPPWNNPFILAVILFVGAREELLRVAGSTLSPVDAEKTTLVSGELDLLIV